MIKRRFYKRGDGDDSSSSSSSSSDSDSDSIHEIEEDEEEEDDEVEVVKNDEEDDEEVEFERAKSVNKKKKEKKSKRNKRSPSPGSGYQSEDSSVNEVNVDSSGLPASEEDESDEKGGHSKFKEVNAVKDGDRTLSSDNPVQSDLADCILKCKSVFKCKLCPRIVCLSEDSVRAHLTSKRHARSKKLLDEGRLRLMLNSDGEIEEDQETHAERHSRTVALAQEPVAPSKTDRGRQRQTLRRKKRKQKASNKEKSEQTTKKSVKKRQKTQV